MTVQVTAIICHNGLGHFKRTMEILIELRKLYQDFTVKLICEKWQIAKMHGWKDLRQFLQKNVELIDGIVAPGIHWAINPKIYSDGRLTEWEKRLEKLNFVRKAEIILSDNLTGILSIRPDALLVGSFLWSDVLKHAYKDSSHVMAFADREQHLLEKNIPYMICLDKLVMPAVIERTKAIRCPWMAKKTGAFIEDSSKKLKKVAVLLGATGYSDHITAEFIKKNRGDDEWLFLVSEKQYTSLNKESVKVGKFHFETDYMSSDVAICRPGIGTITACVASGVPMVMLYEAWNKELMHNAAAVETMGFGIDLGVSPDFVKIESAIRRILTTNKNGEISRKMSYQKFGGSAMAAEWIYKRYIQNAGII